MGDRIVQALIVVIGVACGARRLHSVSSNGCCGSSRKRARPRVRPWLWIGPRCSSCSFPGLSDDLHLHLSLQNKNSTAFVGLDNYLYVFTNHDTLIALRNNVLW